MVASNQSNTLEQLIKPAVEAVGMELWGVEYFSQSGHFILRVYIDSDQGVSLEDCERASHQISGVLDVEDPIKNEYNLEVSSPGMDRPMFRFEQYLAFLGERFKVRLRSALSGRRNFSALLLRAENDQLTFEVEGQQFTVSIDQVDKANLIPNFD